jgi:hypothetical protein
MKNVCYLHHNGFLIFEQRLVTFITLVKIRNAALQKKESLTSKYTGWSRYNLPEEIQ